jgi:hypothetical protein
VKLNVTVAECLRTHPGQRFRARQIAEWIWANHNDACRAKLERSSILKNEDALRQQLVAEIGANRPAISKRYPQVRTTEGRPREYYWTEATEEAEVAALEPSPTVVQSDSAVSELGLYPKLGVYLSAEFALHAQRIDEKRSSNKRGPQGNRWLYPDLVAFEDLTADWTTEVRNCVSEAGAQKARLWSFEVKLLLNRSNVREAYFQAVSNSSWANFAYLVAGDVEGADTLKELRMLSALHGVGLIKLDHDNPAESQIYIPAREKPDIDWANCNRLAAENSDFQKVINLLWQFHRTGDARPSEWKA